MSSVFKPNNAALRKMERELQRSFNKFNITVPVRIEQPEIPHDWVADTSLAPIALSSTPATIRR